MKTLTDSNGTQAAYTYYGDGLRATKTVNGELTRYVYAGGRIIEELGADGDVKARNIWGSEILFRTDNKVGKVGYYFHNGHGDVVKVTDASGNILNNYDYDIWGNILNNSETMSNPFKYTGEVYDDESGFYYLRARYYDPNVGRFINEDTYQGQIDNPLSLNRYTYVHNNPLGFTDPTGHWEETDTKYSDAIQSEIKHLTSLWESAGDDARSQIHAAAEALRGIGDSGDSYSIIRSSTFIPLDTTTVPGVGTFAGDGKDRGFDANSLAVRTQQYSVVDTDTGASTTANYVGATHQITSNGIIEKRAPNTNMSVVSIYQDGTTFLEEKISVSNPLVKIAPPIDYDVFINVNDGRVSGVSNNFPAHEMDISRNGTPYQSLYTYMPSHAGSWYAPFGLFDIFNHEVK